MLARVSAAILLLLFVLALLKVRERHETGHKVQDAGTDRHLGARIHRAATVLHFTKEFRVQKGQLAAFEGTRRQETQACDTKDERREGKASRQSVNDPTDKTSNVCGETKSTGRREGVVEADAFETVAVSLSLKAPETDSVDHSVLDLETIVINVGKLARSTGVETENEAYTHEKRRSETSNAVSVGIKQNKRVRLDLASLMTQVNMITYLRETMFVVG